MEPIVKEYLVDRFRKDVHELADDPSYVHADSPEDWNIKKWFSMYVLTAKFLGLDFWKVLADEANLSEREVLTQMLNDAGLNWGWTPAQEPIVGVPEVDDIEATDMKDWCYRFKGEKETHYGPFKAESVPKLLAKLQAVWPKEKVDRGIEFWLTDSKTYLYPPKEGSGITIYAFDRVLSWRPVRTA